MSRFVEGQDRQQVTLLPECLDDFITEDNPVRVVDAFVEELELQALGFDGTQLADSGYCQNDEGNEVGGRMSVFLCLQRGCNVHRKMQPGISLR